MVRTVQFGVSYWVTLALTVPAAGLLVRIFIFFHDCCHGSFLPDNRANTLLGYFLGTLAFTPFEDWRYTHGRHHATVANLDHRGEGDVWTLTLEEYLKSPKYQKWLYRLFRNPRVLFRLGPFSYFQIQQRFTSRGAGKRGRRETGTRGMGIAQIYAQEPAGGIWSDAGYNKVRGLLKNFPISNLPHETFYILLL